MTPSKYSDDRMMAYESSRRIFERGESLLFDETYRLAHLPLVAPNDPAVIARKDGKDYVMGRYAASRYSAIVPVDYELLSGSQQFQEMEADLRALSFSRKIQWAICDLRRDKLHGTVIGGISEPDIPGVVRSIHAALAIFPPLSFEIGGPFLGRLNTGRVYFPIYPELVNGKDFLSIIQEACGAKVTRFFVIGYYNFAAELTADETADLARFVERWQDKRIARQQLKAIAIQATNDDLVLSSHVTATVPVPQVFGSSLTLAANS